MTTKGIAKYVKKNRSIKLNITEKDKKKKNHQHQQRRNSIV